MNYDSEKSIITGWFRTWLKVWTAMPDHATSTSAGKKNTFSPTWNIWKACFVSFYCLTDFFITYLYLRMHQYCSLCLSCHHLYMKHYLCIIRLLLATASSFTFASSSTDSIAMHQRLLHAFWNTRPSIAEILFCM